MVQFSSSNADWNLLGNRAHFVVYPNSVLGTEHLLREPKVTHCLAAFQGQTGSRIWADGIQFTELLGCLTCLYPRVGRPTHTASRMLCQQGVPTLLCTKRTQWGRVPRCRITEHDSAHAGPLEVMEGSLSGGWRSLTDSISPTLMQIFFLSFPVRGYITSG